LIISVPGKEHKGRHGTTNNTIKELIDLYPTLADLGGFMDEMPSIPQGETLKGILKGVKKGKEKDYAYTIAGVNLPSQG